jgi:hypothetical protein
MAQLVKTYHRHKGPKQAKPAEVKMTTGGTRFVRGGKRGRKSQHHAEAGAVARHSQATVDPGN